MIESSLQVIKFPILPPDNIYKHKSIEGIVVNIMNSQVGFYNEQAHPWISKAYGNDIGLNWVGSGDFRYSLFGKLLCETKMDGDYSAGDRRSLPKRAVSLFVVFSR